MKCRVCINIAIALAWSLVIGHWSFAAEIASPLAPDDAQQLFQLADASLRIELAAAEPEVIDPVAIRFDEDGRMWVAQMHDYPLGVPGGPASQIRVLEDKDGDGRFEKATVFADKLLFVTGLQPWKGGVFVTLAGRVAYMKDTDGDGRADLDETWFEGFAEQNSQLRANHPRLALDNWIYVANGLRGGKVVNRRLKDQPTIDISGMDFRFDPLTGKAEAVSGAGQFGLCFDDWGNRFVCSNRNPCRHVVIEDRYLKASPGVTVPAVVHDVAAFAENSRIYPISRAWTTSNLHAGQFTAACGVYIYRGDLLPAEFKGNVFTCDPTGNLIHREIMQPAGPTFTSKPAYEGKEFLASPDEWFRPVNMELGPDGALYVVDMYRCVIEHPDFVPTELKNRPDLRLGDDRGRIWRIVPADMAGSAANTNPKREQGDQPATPNTSPTRQRGQSSLPLSTAKADDLVKLLEHPNAWQRETAQRLLVEKGVALPEPLRVLASDVRSPLGRAHLLATLKGIGQLTSDDLARSLNDPVADLRKLAVIFCEAQPKLGEAKVNLLHRRADKNYNVALQTMLSSLVTAEDFWNGEEVVFPPDGDLGDRWTRAVLRLRMRDQNVQLFAMRVLGVLRRDEKQPSAETVSFLQELCEQSAVRTTPRMLISDLIQLSGLPEAQPLAIPALLGIARGLAKRRESFMESIRTLQTRANINIPNLLNEIIDNKEADSKLRLDAVALVAYLPDPAFWLLPRTQRDRDQSIRIAAISALSRIPSPDPWPELLAGFPSDTPAVRRAIIDGVLSNIERTKLLLDAIESGKIKPSELDLAQAKRLTESRDAGIKERASKLFAAATPAERVKALADYQPVLKMAGDAKKGQVIFEKNCAACHKIAGIGVNVAPDISDSRTKTTAQLLESILLPNKAIDNNYIGYSVRLVDGTVAAGILSAETATSITLRQQGNKELVVPRSDIEELKSSGLSLMPEGLERQIPPPDMADLLSFIKNWRYLDGRTPLSPGGK